MWRRGWRAESNVSLIRTPERAYGANEVGWLRGTSLGSGVTMRIRQLLPAVAFVAPAWACTPAADPAAEEAAIRDISSRWLEYSRSQDAAGIAGLFADDGTVHWEDRPVTLGKANIEAFIARDNAESVGQEGGFAPEQIYVAASGDLAVEQGTYQGTNSAGRYLTVYRKVDGTWRVQQDMSVGAEPHGGAPEWARQSLARWYEAHNNRDANALADLYTPDARVGDARGRAAIIRMFRDRWAESNPTCSGGYDEFVVVGPIATGWGRDECTFAPAGAGEPTTRRSNWLAVYERQADGAWLCIRDVGEWIEG